MKNAQATAAVLSLSMYACFATGAEAAQREFDFNVPPQPLDTALMSVARQSELRIVFATEMTRQHMSPRLTGNYTPEGALNILLADADLVYRFLDARTVTIHAAGAVSSSTPVDGAFPKPSAADRALAPTAEGAEDSARETEASRERPATRGMPEILVKGSRSTNMDIERSRDGSQPYVVFDRKAIEESGANNVDQFLRQRLTMNTQAETGLQRATGFGGGGSQINLRGLGTRQTLILVDGHRVAGLSQSGEPLQPDLNGIPLSAIERIEVLPTTASAIYGGSATGGVVNIVMRRDYRGVETQASYGSAFSGGYNSRRVNVNAGFALEGGRTNILFSGSWAEDSDLLAGSRDYIERQRAAIVANNGGSLDALSSSAGRPPLGAATNIRSATGVPLTFRGSNLPLGSAITFVPDGFASASSSGTAGLIANAGKYSTGLASTSQPAGGADYPLLSSPTTRTGGFVIRREFSPHWKAFLDASISRNETELTLPVALSANFTVNANAPNNPFNEALNVTVPIPGTYETEIDISQRRAVAGVVAQLPAQWTAELDHTWNESEYHYVTTPPTLMTTSLTNGIRDGSVNVLRDLNAFPLDLGTRLVDTPSTVVPDTGFLLQDTVLRAAGPIDVLAGRPFTLTALLERRTETLDAYQQTTFNGTAFSTVSAGERKQAVSSAYIEMQVPLIVAADEFVAARTLDLQLALRHDRYTTDGTASAVSAGAEIPGGGIRARNKVQSTDPLFGVRYQPLTDVAFRGSYGTGFLPPSVSQLVPTSRPFTPNNVVDPLRNNELVGPVTQVIGGNPDLRPEESKSWSAGVILTPRFAQGLRLSVDYTRIRKTDNIGTFGSIQEQVNSELLFSGIVTREAPGPGETVGRISGLNSSQINIARTDVHAYDAQLDYRLETRFGTFVPFVVGSIQTHFREQLTPQSALIEKVGYTSDAPLKYRASFGMTWDRGPWSLGWTGRYLDSYYIINPAIASAQNARFVTNQGNDGYVSSQSFHDVFAAYRIGAGQAGFMPGWMSDAELRLNVQNVFNTRPAIDTRYEMGYSPFADPRLASYLLTLKVGF